MRAARATTPTAPGPLAAWRRLSLLAALVPLLGAWEPLRTPSTAVEEGNALMKAGKHEDALAAYDKAVAELPGDPGAHFDRGTALMALSRFDEASEEFLRATEAREPGLKSSAFYNLGNAFFKKDKFKEAVEAYKRALMLNPKLDAAKWNLELALKKKREDDQKKKDQKDKNKKDQDKDKNDKGDQNQDKKDQDKKDDQKQDDKDQDKKDQDKKDNNKDDQKQDQPKPEDDQKNGAENQPKPPPQDKDQQPPDQRQIESVLDGLEKSPKELEKQRAQLRAVRRAPPAKDW